MIFNAYIHTHAHKESSILAHKPIKHVIGQKHIHSAGNMMRAFGNEDTGKGIKVKLNDYV